MQKMAEVAAQKPAERIEVLKEELASMKVRALVKRAEELGVDKGELGDVEDKAEVIELILQKMAEVAAQKQSALNPRGVVSISGTMAAADAAAEKARLERVSKLPVATAVRVTVGDPSAIICAENVVDFPEDGRPQPIATRSDWINDSCMCAFFLQVTLAVLVVLLVSLSDEDKAQCSKGAQGACASIDALTRAPHSKPAAMETLSAGTRFP